MPRRSQSQLTSQWMELAFGAPWVIARRLTQFATTTPATHRVDQAEARRMVSEKMQATAESAMAVANATAKMQMDMATGWMRAWSALAMSKAPTARSVSPSLSKTLRHHQQILAPIATKVARNRNRLSKK